MNNFVDEFAAVIRPGSFYSRLDTRVLKQCYREISEPDMEQMALATAQASSIEPPTKLALLEEIPQTSPRCAQVMGFSLHANISVEKNERKLLERLLRYGQMPPFAQKRLSLTPDGKVRLKLRKPYYAGQIEILFEPLDFLRRLAAIIPPPRQNQLRFHGVFAPHSQHHAAIKKLVPKSHSGNTTNENTNDMQKNALAMAEDSPKNTNSRYRLLWAKLLRRTFKIGVLACPKCQGRMKLIALIKDPKVIHKICQHLVKIISNNVIFSRRICEIFMIIVLSHFLFGNHIP